MGGANEIVKIDETVIGKVDGAPKHMKTGQHWSWRNIVMTLVTRGGSARSFHIDGTTHAGSSDRSGGIALTMSSCLASGIFVICSNHTKNITTRHARTYHWRRMRRSPAPSKPPVKRWPCQFWAVCTTNISGRDLRQGQATERSKK
jgi:hypothetical protein